MRGTLVILVVIATMFAGKAQEGNTVLNRPLKNINYMSVDARLGYGIGKPTLITSGNWTVRASVISYFGMGYNFVMKNSWGFDAQINEEIGNFTFGNEGPEFKSGYSSTGLELGVKKIFFKKRDDTFFIRGAFGYNFLVIANDNHTALDTQGETIYYYNSSSNGSSMYVMPELGYQFRFPSGNHILDFSVGYKHALTDVGSVTMTYLDSGNLFDQATANMSGSFIGASIRYSFLFKGFEKQSTTDRKVQDHF